VVRLVIWICCVGFVGICWLAHVGDMGRQHSAIQQAAVWASPLVQLFTAYVVARAVDTVTKDR
jgi:hypothetical protein